MCNHAIAFCFAVSISLHVLHCIPSQGNNIIIINPQRACAARVTVVVLCVCVYVCMCVHSYLPPHTLESQKRDTNGFCEIQ